MGHVLDTIMQNADQIRAGAAEGETLMRLPDTTAKILKDSGIVRMFQPKEFGGYEAHPREAAEAIMALAAQDGASGWVAGIVGVHPWELAFFDRRVQEEVWGPNGENADTWMASPYAPMGVATPTEGGYRLTGRWAFSSGTDHCDWVMIGALLGTAEGTPTDQVLHVIVPRSDYEIVADSWDVVGLRGTGSKDLVINDAFLPDYRTLSADLVLGGDAAGNAGLDQTLYKFPFSCLFPLGITSAIIGMAEGVLNCYVTAQKERVQISGIPIKEDPYVLFAISDAAAEIGASRAALLETVDRFWDKTERGEEITFAERAAGRRTQIAAGWRAVRAMDEIFSRAGGLSAKLDNPIQRFWRDAHVGLTHAIQVPGPTFHSAALTQLGGEPEGALRAMI